MKQISSKILDWYEKNYRIMPWRVSPEEKRNGIIPNPYYVWLSEIMSQQTQIKVMHPYFLKYVERWPDIKSLSKSPKKDILCEWSGLGYYSRAHNLKLCADIICSDYNCIFPSDFEQLKSLPGIGNYTASAISAIAFDIPSIVIETNIRRIVSRLFKINVLIPNAEREIHDFMKKITPLKRAGDFVQAMMDLGASLCKTQYTNCIICPLSENCLSFEKNPTKSFYKKSATIKKPSYVGVAFVILSYTKKIFLQKRCSENRLLQGMSEIPNFFPIEYNHGNLFYAPFTGSWKYQGDIVHNFSHFKLRMFVYMIGDIFEKDLKNGWWVTKEKLKSEALPKLMKKAISKAIPNIFGEKK